MKDKAGSVVSDDGSGFSDYFWWTVGKTRQILNEIRQIRLL